MTWGLSIVRQATVCDGSPPVRPPGSYGTHATGSTAIRRTDSADRLQPQSNPAIVDDTVLSDRICTTASSARGGLETAGDSVSRTGASQGGLLTEAHDGARGTVNIFVPRATSPLTESSDSDYFDAEECQGESTTGLIPEFRSFAEGGVARGHRDQEALEGAGTPETSDDEFNDTRRACLIHHEIYPQFLKRLHEAFHQGVNLSIRRISHVRSTEPVVAANSGRPLAQAEAVDGSQPADKQAQGRFLDRTVNKLSWSEVKKLLQKPAALTTLAEDITHIILDELKQATSQPIAAADRVDEYSVDVPGEEAWVNRFTRSAATLLVYLVHQTCLDGLSWANTDEGQKRVPEMVASLIAGVLDLPIPSSEQAGAEGNSVDGVLRNGIVSALQSGGTFVNKKMEGIGSQAIRLIIDEALARMIGEGIELTERHFDELLSGVKAVIINTLLKVRADTVQIFNKWNQENPDDIHSLRHRIVHKVAQAFASLWKDKGTTFQKMVGLFIDALSSTEKLITEKINKQLDEFIEIFQDAQRFEKELRELIEKYQPEIIPKIKAHLQEVKLEANACKETGDGFNRLVDRVSMQFSSNRQPAMADFREGQGNDPATVQMITQEGRQIAGDMAGLVIGELRDNLEAVKTVVTPGIKAVMERAVNDGATFVARRGDAQRGDAQRGDAQRGDAQRGDAQRGDARRGDAQRGDARRGDAQRGDAQRGDAQYHPEQIRFKTIPGFTAAVAPFLTILVVDVLSQKLGSDAWEKTVTDEVRDAVGQALSDDAGANIDLQTQAPSAIVSAVDRTLGAELASVLRQAARPLQVAISELPCSSLQQLISDFILHSTREGTSWLENLVPELFTRQGDEASVVSMVINSITEEVVNLQHLLVQGAISWARQQGTGRVVETRVGDGMDWLTDWLNDHGDLVARDVQARVKAMLQQVTPELEAVILRRLASLRTAVEKSQHEQSNALAFVQQAAKDLDPEPEGDLEQPGQVLVDTLNERDTRGGDLLQAPDRWRATRKAAAGEAGRAALELTSLMIDETGKQLQAVKSVLAGTIGEVMEVIVREVAVFGVQRSDAQRSDAQRSDAQRSDTQRSDAQRNDAQRNDAQRNDAQRNDAQRDDPQHNSETEYADAVFRLTGVVSPILMTRIVEKLCNHFLCDLWKNKTATGVQRAVEQALAPGDKPQEPAGKPPMTEADKVMTEGIADLLREGADRLEAVLQDQPYDSVKQLASDLVLQGVEAGSGWLDLLVKDLFAENEVVVPRVIDAITRQAVATQQSLFTGVLGWLRTEDHQAYQLHRQQLLDILMPRVRALVTSAVTDVAGQVAETTQQAPQSVIDGVLPFLHDRLDQSQALATLADQSVDYLADWLHDHGQVIRQDVEKQALAMMAAARPALETIIHQRLVTLRSVVASHRQPDGVTTLRQAADQLAPANSLVTDTDERPEVKRWCTTQQAATCELGETAGALTGLMIGELRDNLETVRSMVTPHINEVMTELVNQGAAFTARSLDAQPGDDAQRGDAQRSDAQRSDAQRSDAQHNSEPTRPDSIPGFTKTMAPWLTTSVVELLSQRLMSDVWCSEITTGIQDATKTALTNGPPGTTNNGTADNVSQVAGQFVKEGMAAALRQGANQLQGSGKFPHGSLKQLVNDFVLQSTRDGASWLEDLVKALYASEGSDQSVVERVMVKVTREVMAVQRELVQGIAGWIRSQPSHRLELINLLSPRVRSLVAPVVGDVAGQLADQTAVPPQQWVSGVMPYLQQLARGQTVEALVGYSVDWLTDWVDKNALLIEGDVDTCTRLLMTGIIKDLQPIIGRQLKVLRDSALKSQHWEESAVIFARRTAQAFAPARASDVVDSRSGDHQSQWADLLLSLIPSLSDGITAVIQQGVNTICAQGSALPIIVPHVQRIVSEAVSAGAGYGIHRLAEPSDGDVNHIERAVTGHLQGIIAGCLSQGVADGIEYAADSVSNNADTLQESVANALRQQLQGKGEVNSTDLASLLTPHLNKRINQALNEAQGLVREGMTKWIAHNASVSTPQLHRAIDQILTHIMAHGGEWIFRNQAGIANDVMPRIQNAVTETLRNAKNDIVRNVAAWISDEAHLNGLVSTFTHDMKGAVTDIVIQSAAKHIAEKTGQNIHHVVDSITPYITPLLDRTLTHTAAYCVRWLSDWVQSHEAEISSLVDPYIEKTVREVMPAVHTAVQNKALLLAQNKAQTINFNSLAAEMAVAFADRLDPASVTSGAVTVGPKTNVAKELPKLLCLLMQTAETYQCLGGNLTEPVKIDRMVIAGREFKNIRADLVRMGDGSIHIRHLNLIFRDTDEIDIDIEMTGISLSYQLPEKSKLYKAALLSGTSMMNPEDAARRLFDTFLPDNIHINIDQITGEFRDDVLDGPEEDTIGFGLGKIKFSLRFHQYYPKLYMDIRVGPQKPSQSIESIKASVQGQGLVEHVDADVHIDHNRNGYVDVSGQADPGKVNRVLGWLVGGKVHVSTKVLVKKGIAVLDDIKSIRVTTDNRFAWFCNALLKNTLRANNPGFVLGDDGKAVIKLQLTPFSQNRTNPITRWLAKAANRIFQFFSKPIEIPMSFKGTPYSPASSPASSLASSLASKSKKGLGTFNLGRFIDGLSPWPLSIQSDTHEELLRGLRLVSGSQDPQAHMRQLDKVIDHVIDEFTLGNTPSDLGLVREIPVESLLLLVNNVKHNVKHYKSGQDLARLLFLVANLVEALPEKAVQLVNMSGVTADSGGQPYLLHLISAAPKASWLTRAEDGRLLEPVYQDQQFNRLREYWQNSRSNPDGSIYSPDREKGIVQECGEKAAEWMNQLNDTLSIPNEVKLMMARDFDFSDNMFNPLTSHKQGLMASTPASQVPFRLPRLTPVGVTRRLDWQKPGRLGIPYGVERVNRSTAA